MQSMEELEARFERDFQVLADELSASRSRIDVFKELIGAVGVYNDEMNHAPGFWGLTIESYRVLGLLGLSRLLIRNKDSLTIHKFLDWIEQNTVIFSKSRLPEHVGQWFTYGEELAKHQQEQAQVPAMVKEHKAALAELEHTIENLKAHRDTRIAHLDLRHIGRDIESLYPIDTSGIEKVLTVLSDILRYYGRAYNTTDWALNSRGTNQIAEAILDPVRRDWIARRAARGFHSE